MLRNTHIDLLSAGNGGASAAGRWVPVTGKGEGAIWHPRPRWHPQQRRVRGAGVREVQNHLRSQQRRGPHPGSCCWELGGSGHRLGGWRGPQEPPGPSRKSGNKPASLQGWRSTRCHTPGKWKTTAGGPDNHQFRASFLQSWRSGASAQLSSVAQSCLTLCDPMNHSTPGLPVHHQLPEFTQTHVH